MNQACAVCQKLYWETDDFLTNKRYFICPECYRAGYRVETKYSNNTVAEDSNCQNHQ